ncbi:zinc finger protein 708-like [Anopheles maculipalpis]|uniref:zinc finger protein 708-like n=1 Tax=Anopheles maculipalpis TaxID=1496333 RepID=UPI002158FD14|nr:zinc finger protein 708-like [Anopheles maculipalpis]
MNQTIICRVCASTDNAELDLVDIFVKHEDHECIADILLELAGIKATVDDGFPPKCCRQCQTDLTNAVSVRRKCIESEKLIQASLDANSVSHFDAQSDNVSIASIKEEQLSMYRCWECSIDFCSAEPLQQHYESLHANAIHGWKSFGISEVSLFDTTDDEAAPVRSVMADKKPVKQYYRCCGCPQEFDTETELQQHSKTEHAPNAIEPTEDKPIQCEICYHTYTTKWGVVAHRSTKTMLNHQCAYCGVLYGSIHPLRYHEYKHTNHTFDCNICGKIFFKSCHLKRHQGSVHVEPNLRTKYSCNVCGVRVNTTAYLKTHMKLHSTEKPFVCKLCGASFKLKMYLTWHMIKHRGVHKCMECEMTFKAQSELQDHSHVHEGTRPFSCSLCNGKYTTSKNLTRHMRKKHAQYKRKQV